VCVNECSVIPRHEACTAEASSRLFTGKGTSTVRRVTHAILDRSSTVAQVGISFVPRTPCTAA